MDITCYPQITVAYNPSYFCSWIWGSAALGWACLGVVLLPFLRPMGEPGTSLPGWQQMCTRSLGAQARRADGPFLLILLAEASHVARFKWRGGEIHPSHSGRALRGSWQRAQVQGDQGPEASDVLCRAPTQRRALCPEPGIRSKQAVVVTVLTGLQKSVNK